MSAIGLDPWLSAASRHGESDRQVPVTVILGGALTHLVGGATGAELERCLHERMRELLWELGVPGEPLVQMDGDEGGRGLELRVHGRRLPYPPGLMKRVWLSSCPPELAEVCLRPAENPSGFPDGWLHSFVDAEGVSDSGRDQLIRYVAELVSAIVGLRASCVLSAAQLDWYVNDDLPGNPRRLSGWPQSMLEPLLGQLLDQGITLTRLDELNEALLTVTGVLPTDLISMREEVLGRVAAGEVGVVVHPDHLVDMNLGRSLVEPISVYETDEDDQFKVVDELRTNFAAMEEAIYSELGISVPDLLMLPDDTMPPGRMAVRVNDRVGPAMQVPSASECFVNGTVEELGAAGIPARPALNPLLNETQANIDSELAKTAEGLGFTTWNPAEFTVFFVAVEVRRVAGRLVTLQYVEYKLAQLENSHPELTLRAGAEGGVSSGELTLVLRQLLEEGLPVVDLRLIVDCILSHRPLAVDPDTHHLCDERYPLAAPRDPGDRWLDLVEAVRGRMKLHIAHRFGVSPGTMIVYLLDPAIEAAAAALPTDAAEAGAELGETLRELCWAELSHLPPHTRKPAILTTAGARPWVRLALEREFPEVAVLSYLELPPEVNVMPMARIAPQPTDAD